MQQETNKQNNLVLYRRRMGFTQKQVAKLLGYGDPSSISHYESGRALPPLVVALSFEVLYRTPVAFLFPGLSGDLQKSLREKEERLFSAPGQTALPLTPTHHDGASR